MELHWAEPGNWLLLFLLPPLALLFYLAEKRTWLALSKIFKDEFFRSRLRPLNRSWRTGRYSLILGSAFLLVVVLARPQGKVDEEVVQAEARDMYFVLDVSRSMLARDVKPDRLSYSKELIAQMAEASEGNRVGLVVFAGRAKIAVPLTLDVEYFIEKLESVSPDEIQVGGTAISVALRLAKSLLGNDEQAPAGVVLITDGEEQSGDPVEAARELAAQGVSVYALGIGEDGGAKIPQDDQTQSDGNRRFLTYQGKEIVSKLDEKTLKSIAETTEGVYFPVKKKRIDAKEIYRKYVLDTENRKMKERKVPTYREHYQIFLLVAVVLLIAEYAFREKG